MAALIPALQAVQAGAAALKQIQSLNEAEQSQDVEKTSLEEGGAVDPQQDSTLAKDDGALSKTSGINFQGHLRIQVGSVDIGFTLHLTKEKGRENTPEIGLEAQDKVGQTMKGILGETKDKDQQGTFTPEAWGKVQEKRQDCVNAASKGLTHSGSAQAEKELGK